jgi:hypothetical protein
MTSKTSVVKGLPDFARHITTHDKNGVAVFETSSSNPVPGMTSNGAGHLSPLPSWFNFPNSGFGLGYATNDMPPDMNDDADLKTYNGYQERHPGIVIKGGSVFRVVDLDCGAESPMHRTVSDDKVSVAVVPKLTTLQVSIDYGVVLEGEIELELDSGEKRLLKRGDLFVQRGTMHKWKNLSDIHPARLVAVQLESKEVVSDGKTLPATI